MTSGNKLLVIPVREEKTPLSRTKPEPLLDSSKTFFKRLQTLTVRFSFVPPSIVIKKAFKKDCVYQIIAHKP